MDRNQLLDRFLKLPLDEFEAARLRLGTHSAFLHGSLEMRKAQYFEIIEDQGRLAELEAVVFSEPHTSLSMSRRNKLLDDLLELPPGKFHILRLRLGVDRGLLEGSLISRKVQFFELAEQRNQVAELKAVLSELSIPPTPEVTRHSSVSVGPKRHFRFANSWLEKLAKSIRGMWKSHPDDMKALNKDFVQEPDTLAELYIEPDCQERNPANVDERAALPRVASRISNTLEEYFSSGTPAGGGRHLFILSDAGMGKTSLLVMLRLGYLAGCWSEGYTCALLKLGPSTLDDIDRIEDPDRCILLLDSLDEDPNAFGRIDKRLEELLETTERFRRVLITCRTQFFPASVEDSGAVVAAGYMCYARYLSPFSDKQVSAYLKRRFPDERRYLLWKREHRQYEQASELLLALGSLRFRPMLLARIDDLLKAGLTSSSSEFSVYEALVRWWLIREVNKLDPKTKKELKRSLEAKVLKFEFLWEALWEACANMAIFLQDAKRTNNQLHITGFELEELIERYPVTHALRNINIGGRSLLNRNGDGHYRFAHYSVQEFLAAWAVSRNRVAKDVLLRETDQLLTFLGWGTPGFPWWVFDWSRVSPYRIFSLTKLDIEELEQDFVVVGARLAKADLSKVDLNGVVLFGANLKEANFNCANLVRADLREADLSGADLSGANLGEAYYSLFTIWPKGFDPKDPIHGLKLIG